MQNTLYDYEDFVRGAHEAAERAQIPQRIAAHDHTVWAESPQEITNRLGWLDVAARMRAELPDINKMVATVNADGFTDVVLCGMGGSSLAPEVFHDIFGGQGLHLSVSDSTSPAAVLALRDRLPLATTLFVVSSKSGGTVETLSFFKYFYGEIQEVVGADAAGAHFVAITDPGSKLAALGEKLGFRRVFLADPNIGGRYSALTHFGLVPAALVGVDLDLLLDRAEEMMAFADLNQSPHRNPGFMLGTLIAAAHDQGRDKLTLVLPPAIESFGNWVEQLVAESVGKAGDGVLPVVGEPLGTPEVYGDDRLFVYFQLHGEETLNPAVYELELAGHPVIRLDVRDAYDLGGEFFRWELATAVLGYHMRINPFDQPNVEAAKVLAREFVARYTESGELPQATPTLRDGPIELYGQDVTAQTAAAAVRRFLADAAAGDYCAIQAYLPPTAELSAHLAQLQQEIRQATRLATTIGFGPRFLHSTGQLHKGDAGNGLFLIFTTDAAVDAPIPDEPGADTAALTFGVLIQAQALGDQQALLDGERRVLRLHLSGDPGAALSDFVTAVFAADA